MPHGYQANPSASNPDNYPYYSRKIATVQNISANSLASTAVSFEAGLSLSKVNPSFAIFKYRGGSFTGGAARFELGATVLSPSIPLSGLATTATIFSPILAAAFLVPNASTLQVEVTTTNTGAATFDCDLYGYQYLQ